MGVEIRSPDYDYDRKDSLSRQMIESQAHTSRVWYDYYFRWVTVRSGKLPCVRVRNIKLNH